MEAVSNDYVTRLMNSGTPVEIQVVHGVGHAITSFAAGRKALFNAITKR